MLSLNRSLPLLFALSFWPAAGPLRAEVIVTTLASLTQLTIAPQNPSATFFFVGAQNNPLAPPNCTSANLCATAFAQAQDSLGGFSQQYDAEDNATASASANTALASASSTASEPAMTSISQSGVGIPNITASALSEIGNGNPASLLGEFSVSAATTLQFSASITIEQSLFTDNFGVSGSSEAQVGIFLGNGDVPIFFDNPLTIGPNDSAAFSSTSALNGTTSLLQPNTNYDIFIQTDAESSGVTMAPDPSSVCLSATVLGLILALRLRNNLSTWRAKRYK